MFWERLAITEDQVKELKAQGMKPVYKADGRSNSKEKRPAWECEALGQSKLEAITTARLEEMLPRPLEETQEDEERQREVWLDRLRGFKE